MADGDDPDLAPPPSRHRASSGLLERLFRVEQPRLARYLRRRVRDPEDVRDIVQEAFVRLAAARPDAALRCPEAYLQQIIRNLLRDRSKRAAKRPAFGRVGFDGATEIAVPPDQEWAIEARDLMRRYRQAVDAMPPRMREVFLMHRVNELKYAEIAVRLGISVATVEYHIARALVHLDKVLDR